MLFDRTLGSKHVTAAAMPVNSPQTVPDKCFVHSHTLHLRNSLLDRVTTYFLEPEDQELNTLCMSVLRLTEPLRMMS